MTGKWEPELEVGDVVRGFRKREKFRRSVQATTRRAPEE
jgi:hypothetical protein